MRILIAEDERITRKSLQRELERWGHEVTAEEDGAEAWETYRRESFDMVVTDWDMPRMDGRELVQRIRGHDRSSYVYLIMLTGRSEKHDLVAGMEAGADDFLAKPFDRDELRVRLAAGERIIQLERRLAEQKDKLQAANERMHLDLRAAARVQQQLLPAALPKISGLNFAWRYRPCDELGGDLLNVLPVGESGAVMYLADVSGHGVSASLVSVSVHRSLSVRGDRSSLILTADGEGGGLRAVSPSEVATRLNNLYPMSSNGGHYLTLAYGTIDARTLRFDFCSAGHPGPVLARRGEPVRSEDSNGFPIGMVSGAEFEFATLQLRPGDRVYLYSDGILEAISPENVHFGRERIEAAIDGSRERPLGESIDAMVEAALAWCKSDRFGDDLSIVAMEVGEG